MAFPTTRWTLIRQAAAEQSDQSRRALCDLCQQYASPVLAFVRRRVSSPEKAEDIAQSFFAQLLEGGMLQRADETRGPFRAFLLHALRGFLSDVHHHDNAKKRGGGRQHASFNDATILEPQHTVTPEREFELLWIRTVLSTSLDKLESEYGDSDRRILFDNLKMRLDSTSQTSNAQLAEQLRMSESAVRVALHRMRKRLGKLIREQIADTVQAPGEVDEELLHLMQLLEKKS